MTLLVPFLDGSPRYCRGVELGMQVVARMQQGHDRISGYVRSLNEEQVRLAAHRMGYDVTRCRPWRFEGRRTGWVYVAMVRRPELTDGAGI